VFGALLLIVVFAFLCRPMLRDVWVGIPDQPFRNEPQQLEAENSTNRPRPTTTKVHEEEPVEMVKVKPKFVLDNSDYAKTDQPIPEMPFTAYDPVQPKEPGMVVPDIVHYIWLDGKDDLYLTFSQYLAMRSVIVRQKPAKLFMWGGSHRSVWAITDGQALQY
jgi:hypothetical protein